MLKYILTAILFVSVSFAKASYKEELNNLTPDQMAVFMHSLSEGKNDDLSLTLAAIAWKESHFGNNKVNKTDGKHGSYGTHQILLTTAASYLKKNKIVNVNLKNKKQKEVLIKFLTEKEEISSYFALEELKYWSGRHKGDWKKMVASYNAGNKGINSEAGEKYYKDVAYRVKLIKEYIASNNIVY